MGVVQEGVVQMTVKMEKTNLERKPKREERRSIRVFSQEPAETRDERLWPMKKK
jgi:hypothetical protein